MKHVAAKNIHYSGHGWRIAALWWFFVIFGAVIIIKLFFLQIVHHDDYQQLGQSQHQIERQLQARRGTIYTQDTKVDKSSPNRLIAAGLDREFYLLYGQPALVEDPQKTVDKLNEVLALAPEINARLVEQLSKIDDPFEPLVHRVTSEKIEQVAALKLPGIKWQPENLRYYPDGNLGSHVLGFVSTAEVKSQGQYGIEGYFNEILAGRDGLIIGQKGAGGGILGIGQKTNQEAIDGSSIVLTIDHTLQTVACQKLNEAVEKYDAIGGSVIILQPQTGAILAMCGQPDFDPNDYKNVDNVATYINPAIFAAYEPGSVFKALTMAMAIDQDKITPETTYQDTGEIKIDTFTIRNSDLLAHGQQTMIEVLEKSLNTGAIFAMQQIGGSVFKDYVDKFGFGVLTGITLDGEAAGDISSLDQKGEIYPITASFGQGISVTPLQMVTAFGVLANGGKLVKPYIVDKIISPDGEEKVTSPQEIGQVISARAANLVSGMLVSVVRNGHSYKAGVPGYYIAAKTGTAQIASASGGYGASTNHTLVGYGPVTKPIFVMLVRLEAPTTAKFAESTSGPVFGELTKFILQYYNIPPDDQTAQSTR